VLLGAYRVFRQPRCDTRGGSPHQCARMAMVGAYVTVIDKSCRALRARPPIWAQLHTLFSTMENIERESAADLVIVRC